MTALHTSDSFRLVIIGGVAGGATAAARARRLSESARITIVERDPYITYANCGLPYHVGGIIDDRATLLLQTPNSFNALYNVEVRVNHEATAINRNGHMVAVKDLQTGQTTDIPYDKLILATGARAVVPPLPGVDRPNVFTLKTIPDMDRIVAWIKGKKPRHATVVGGGYIGLETAENLKHIGLEVTLIEMTDHVMPPVDLEMAAIVHEHLKLHGIDLRLKARLTALCDAGERTKVEAEGAGPFETDLIIMAIGVRPENKLARECGLRIGERGGVVVDDRLCTSDPDIYAVGDVIEVTDPVTDSKTLIPLAGPANRQARIAADNVFGRDSRYRGTQGTAICKVFDLGVGFTGASEKVLKRLGLPYRKAVLHPFSHASYYPGACRMTLKILFSPDSGKLLGAQAVGSEGVDKRMDVLATAMAAGMSVYDLEHLELCYAPPYGAAKDPVNLAGNVAANILRGDHDAVDPDELRKLPAGSFTLVDIRQPEQNKAGAIPGSILIPLAELRRRHAEIPLDRDVVVYCQVGQRAYVAQRILSQKGFRCHNLLGGYRSWSLAGPPVPAHAGAEGVPPGRAPCASAGCCGEERDEGTATPPPGDVVTLDACGLQCPGPLLKMQKCMTELAPGQQLKVIATDPGFPGDAAGWARSSGHRLASMAAENGRFVATVEKGASAPATAQSAVPAVPSGAKKLTIVVFSNDLDRAMAAMVIANGAAAMGMETTLFFTFWGLSVLRKAKPPSVSKGFLHRLLDMMMPRGPGKLALSKMHMAGVGTALMKHLMASKSVDSLPGLVRSARQAGVRFVACSMSMDVMGIKKEELMDGVEVGGVAAYLASAGEGTVNLFI